MNKEEFIVLRLEQSETVEVVRKYNGISYTPPWGNGEIMQKLGSHQVCPVTMGSQSHVRRLSLVVVRNTKGFSDYC